MVRLLPALLAIALPASAVELPKDARLAIIGDSITEHAIYSGFVETYIRACAGRKDVRCFVFGRGGQTVGGFQARAANDLPLFQPTAATLCFGMNDGAYQPFSEATGQHFESGMRAVLARLKALGVQTVVLGSPGAVDTFYFKRLSPAIYNDSLAHLRDIGRSIAADERVAFVDLHEEMLRAMKAAKAALGEQHSVAGKDGLHPSRNGHLLMALSFLKSLGFDGRIGEITLDMHGPSTASEGHAAEGVNGHAIVTSTRWPFHFDAEMRETLPFCDFTERLNRFTLKVQHLDASHAKVTWGEMTKEFTREQLSAGVNLLAEFDSTPLRPAFYAFADAVYARQSYEVEMIAKTFARMQRVPSWLVPLSPPMQASFEVIKHSALAKREKLEQAADALLVPVQHRIEVTPMK